MTKPKRNPLLKRIKQPDDVSDEVYRQAVRAQGLQEKLDAKEEVADERDNELKENGK